MKEIEKAGMINMNNAYFFDTYAFFEIIEGNPKYEIYKESIVITTIFNLAELNYNLKKEMTYEMADSYLEKYWDCMEDINIKDIKNAMNLKSKNREFSIPDAIGYAVAERLGIKFLTGDEGFKNLDNVEFIKK